MKFTPQVVKQPPAGAVTVGTPTFTSNTATVNVTSLGDETGSVAVVLEYALDQAFTTPVEKTGTAVTKAGSQNFSLADLTPGKTYYVRARLTGSVLKLETVTDVVSFTTPAYTAPVIASVSAKSDSAASATISVNVSALGQGSASATVAVYVSTGAFGAEAAASGTISAAGTTTYAISGLQAGTAYFVKVVVTGSNGLSATNTDASFVTGTVEPPAGTLAIGSVTASGASATVALTSLGDGSTSVAVAVEYATDAAFSSKKTASGTAKTAPGSQVLALTGLTGETKYYARAVFTGAPSGLVGYSETVEFTTLGAQPPAAMLTVSDIGFDAATATLALTSLGDGATSVAATLLLSESADFADAATVSEVRFAKVGSEPFALSDLKEGTTYRLRAVLTGAPSGLTATVETSFRTEAFGAPALGEGGDEHTHVAATISVPLLSLGAGSDSVEVKICLSKEYSCVGGTIQTRTLTEPGMVALSWSDLDPGTDYYWLATATGSNGKVAETRGSFTTGLFPLALGAATATPLESGVAATMRVSLLNLESPPATVKLYLGGELIQTWTGVTAPRDFDFTASTQPNKTYTFSFVATAGGETVTSGGSFTTTAAQDWFNVRWGEDGYAKGTAWNVAAAVPASGGAWTRPADDESAFDGERLALVPPDAGVPVLRFTPTGSMKKGADLTIEGRTLVAVGTFSDDMPAPTVGGLIFLESGIVGWTRDGWLQLRGAVPDDGVEVAWKIEAKFSGDVPSIRYTVGETILTDADGAAWLSLAPGLEAASAVGFAGAGKIGDFRGYYKALVVGSFEKPNFGAASADGSALGFGTDPATGKATFSVSIDNASADADYAVYVCDTVDGDYVLDAKAAQSGSGAFLTFTMVDDAATKFVKIVAAEPGYDFPARFADIEF